MLYIALVYVVFLSYLPFSSSFQNKFYQWFTYTISDALKKLLICCLYIV